MVRNDKPNEPQKLSSLSAEAVSGAAMVCWNSLDISKKGFVQVLSLYIILYHLVQVLGMPRKGPLPNNLPLRKVLSTVGLLFPQVVVELYVGE
jgi:hypothetical protein